MKNIFYLFFILLAAACQKDNFKEYSKLEDFRVLALVPDAPEVNAGSTVTITPYLSDVANSGPYTYSAKACLDPGVAYGAKPSCENSSSLVNVSSGTVTGLSGSTYSGPVNAISVTVPASILALYSAIDQYNGVSYILTYDVSNSQGKTVSTFHRIIVSTRSTKNTNPIVSDILGNGVSLGTLSVGSKTELTLSLSGGYQESYDYKKSDGSLDVSTESPLITYFYMDGSTKYFRTAGPSEVNIYTAPDSFPSTRNSFIYVVVRDGRGGIAVGSRQIN